MDKLLAFSILSASPADIAGGHWALLSWRRGDQPAEAEKQRDKEGSHSQQQPPPPQEEKRPRFALEFDGIDCFETIVWH